MNSTQVPQSEKQEQPAKEGQKHFSLPLIKIKVLHWRRKPSKKLRLTALAGESNDLLRMPPPPSKCYHAPTAHHKPVEDNSCPHGSQVKRQG